MNHKPVAIFNIIPGTAAIFYRDITTDICLQCPLQPGICESATPLQTGSIRKRATEPECCIDFAIWHGIGLPTAAAVARLKLYQDAPQSVEWYRRSIRRIANHDRITERLMAEYGAQNNGIRCVEDA